MNHTKNDIVLSTSFFAEVSAGIVKIKNEFVYKGYNAEHWLSLASSNNYPYYFKELEQVFDLTAKGYFNQLSQHQCGVFLGAADARKELAIIAGVFTDPKNVEFIVVDSSKLLLDLAVSEISKKTGANARGYNIDVSNSSKFANILEIARQNEQGNVFLSCFGNMLGNYGDLVMLESICKIMNSGEQIIFGIHNKIAGSDGIPYKAYESAEYLGHMNSILLSVGIPLSAGELTVDLVSSGSLNSDVIEISFLFHSYINGVLKNDTVEKKEWRNIGKILIDSSSKFDLRYVKIELEKMGFLIDGIWSSRPLLNTIILCTKL